MTGLPLTPLSVKEDGDNRHYSALTLEVDNARRVATITMKAPTDTAIDTLDGIHQAGADWWPLEHSGHEDALFHLRQPTRYWLRNAAH